MKIIRLVLAVFIIITGMGFGALYSQSHHQEAAPAAEGVLPGEDAGPDIEGEEEGSELVDGVVVAEHGDEVHHAETSDYNFNEVMSHHLGDSDVLKIKKIAGIDLSITKRVVMLWIAAFFMLIIFIPAARSIAKNRFRKPGRATGMLEVFVNFIRHDVADAAMGHHSKSYEPFLLTLFFFILFSNLLGLVPPLGEIAHLVGQWTGISHAAEGHGAHETPLLAKIWPGITATGDLSVTGTLAILSFLVIQLTGFVYQGVAYVRNIVPKGVPGFVWPIMWVVEALGKITKPVALALRLLANMTAGHMLILVILGFIFQFQSIGVAFISVPASVAIYLLELFVAFLQAYIFVFLTALFIAESQHRH